MSLDGANARRLEPRVAVGLAVLALAFLGLGESRVLGWLAAFSITLCAAVNVRVPLSVIRASAPLRWMAPLGLVLSTLAVLFDSEPESQRWALLGCAVAALLLSSRNAVHTWANGPVWRAGRELDAALPTWTRIPSPSAASYEEVPAHALRPGDVTVVLEGERLAVDGVVEEGDGIALLYPRAPRHSRVGPGAFLLAGTKVIEGALTVRAQRTQHERAIARVLDLRLEAASGSSRLARIRRLLATWGWIPIAVLPAAFAVADGVSTAGALLLGLPVLAFVAAIDSPLESAARAAARRGMFFGRESALFDAARVRTTAILLRGALTASDPVVKHVRSLGDAELDRAIGLAAAAERLAREHPIARAIVRYASELDIPHATIRKEQLHPGLGITAVSVGGGSVVVGRRQLLLNEGISVAAADDEAKRIENEGLTAIFIAVDENLAALLAVLDPTHVGAPDAVRRFAELPSEVVILSGDDRRTVERIAQQLGAARVKAPLLPNERASEVRALRDTGGITAAVGQGGEDEAVLAAADVPVSLRLVGTATEQRGIVAAGRDVRDAAGALWIARAARRATVRGLTAAVAVLLLVAAGALLGWLTPPLATAIAMGAEVWALRAGSRLLRRVDLRVPMRR